MDMDTAGERYSDVKSIQQLLFAAMELEQPVLWKAATVSATIANVNMVICTARDMVMVVDMVSSDEFWHVT